MGALYPPSLTPALLQILGMLPYQLHPIWMALRETGAEIPKRYEDEVAAALHFLIPFALLHPDGAHPGGWQTAAANELRRLREKRAAPPERFSADATAAGDQIEVTVYSSRDPGPAKRFDPIVTVQLDEAHATELLGTLMIALDKARAG